MLEPPVEYLKNSESEILKKPMGTSIAATSNVASSPCVSDSFRGYLQTFAAGLYLNLFMYLPFIAWFFTAFLMIYFGFLGRTLLFIYFAYIYYDHKTTHSTIHGNGLMFFRDNFLTDLAREYYPVKLVKTAELPPNRNYLVACFPHGVISTGIAVNMSINIRSWLELFPGVRPKLVTLDMYLRTPFLRDLGRSWGFVASAKEAIMRQLNKSNDPHHPHNSDGFTSNALGIVIGGAQEAFDSRPGKYILTLKQRMGFVKIAIQTGCPIVPSFSFGEVDILDQLDSPSNTLLKKFQVLFKRVTGIAPIIAIGRGFIRQGLGVLPFRKPIVQVVGAPIDVKKTAEPDPKYVDEIHQKVIDSVNEMFEKYKYKYIENPESTKLIIN
uniref:Acyltransferase n=1 Tax=Stomoxys calcitrans TaxID=35570 RepID=A0A1I8Q9Q8_STOCA